MLVKHLRILLLSFVLPILLMGTVFYLIGFYPLSDGTINSGDYSVQYLPLYVALKQMLVTGDFSQLFWSFQKSLGGAMPSLWGFNSLSPLTFIYVLFPVSFFPEVTLITTLLRYGLMGLAFAYFLVKRYPVSEEKAYLPLLFSVTYALSGYMVAMQMNPNFLDNLVYFPLLLLWTEEGLDGRWTWWLPVGIVIVVITQFYTAYMLGLFLVIYSVAYLARNQKSLIENLKVWGLYVAFCLSGVFLAAIWWLPVLNALVDSKASSGATFPFIWTYINNPVDLLAKFFVGSFGSVEWGDAQSLPQLFIGGLGFIGFLAFFLLREVPRRDKIATAIVLLIFVVSFIFEFPDRLWQMGQRPNGFYYRYSWTASTFMLVTAFRAFRGEVTFGKKQVTWLGLGIAMAGAFVYSRHYNILTGWQIFLTLVVWFGLMALLQVKRKSLPILMLIMALTFLELGSNAWMGLSRIAYALSHQGLVEQVAKYHRYDVLLPKENEFYRMEVNKKLIEADLPMIAHYPGVSHFTSSLEYRIQDNLGKLGLPTSTSFVNYTNRMPLTDALFSMKYFVDQVPAQANQSDLLATYHLFTDYGEQKGYYQNDYALGPAFMVSSDFNALQLGPDPVANQNTIMRLLFNTSEDLFQPTAINRIRLNNLTNQANSFVRIQADAPTQLNLTVAAKGQYTYYLRVPVETSTVMNQSVLTLNNQPYSYADRFTYDQLWTLGYADRDRSLNFGIQSQQVASYPFERLGVYAFDVNRFREGIKAKQQDNLILVSYQPWKFTFKVPQFRPENNAVFTSIPYNRGWRVTINGQPVASYPVWGTFLGFNIDQQSQDIVLTYHPPGLMVGSGLAILGLIALIGLLVFVRYDDKEVEAEMI